MATDVSPVEKRLMALWGIAKNAWGSLQARTRVLIKLLTESFGGDSHPNDEVDLDMGQIVDPKPLPPVPSVPAPPEDLIPPLRES